MKAYPLEDFRNFRQVSEGFLSSMVMPYELVVGDDDLCETLSRLDGKFVRITIERMSDETRVPA